jgi:hypothetical protein
MDGICAFVAIKTWYQMSLSPLNSRGSALVIPFAPTERPESISHALETALQTSTCGKDKHIHPPEARRSSTSHPIPSVGAWFSLSETVQ